MNTRQLEQLEAELAEAKALIAALHTFHGDTAEKVTWALRRTDEECVETADGFQVVTRTGHVQFEGSEVELFRWLTVDTAQEEAVEELASEFGVCLTIEKGQVVVTFGANEKVCLCKPNSIDAVRAELRKALEFELDLISDQAGGKRLWLENDHVFAKVFGHDTKLVHVRNRDDAPKVLEAKLQEDPPTAMCMRCGGCGCQACNNEGEVAA